MSRAALKAVLVGFGEDALEYAEVIETVEDVDVVACLARRPDAWPTWQELVAAQFRWYFTALDVEELKPDVYVVNALATAPLEVFRAIRPVVGGDRRVGLMIVNPGSMSAYDAATLSDEAFGTRILVTCKLGGYRDGVVTRSRVVPKIGGITKVVARGVTLQEAGFIQGLLGRPVHDTVQCAEPDEQGRVTTILVTKGRTPVDDDADVVLEPGDPDKVRVKLEATSGAVASVKRIGSTYTRLGRREWDTKWSSTTADTDDRHILENLAWSVRDSSGGNLLVPFRAFAGALSVQDAGVRSLENHGRAEPVARRLLWP